jgi:hypothetical protein
VGKVPGLRARKKRAPISGPPSSFPAASASHARRRSESIGLEEPQEHHDFESAISNWMPCVEHPLDDEGMPMQDMSDIFGGSFELELPPAPEITAGPNVPPSSQQSISTADTEPMGLNIDFDSGTGNYASSVTTNTTGEPARPQEPVSSPPVRKAFKAQPPTEPNIDSQCVLACCQIITNLETYIDASVRVLDLNLTMVKNALDTLSQVVSMQRDSRNSRCQMLFGVIMYQIIKLLERGCGDFLSKGPTSAGGQLSKFEVGGGIFPGFGFGGFQVDVGQQRAWRARVVLRELQQVNEMLQRISAGRVEPGQQPGTCLSDLERRLGVLCEHLKRVEN